VLKCMGPALIPTTSSRMGISCDLVANIQVVTSEIVTVFTVYIMKIAGLEFACLDQVYYLKVN